MKQSQPVTKPNHRTGRTPQRARNWRPRFLAALEETKLVTEACKVAGVGRSTVYDARREDPVFAAQWEELEASLIERMEAEAYRRAVDGVTKPLVSAGKYVTDVQEFSDGLLMFLLRARRPHIYRERVDVKHTGGVDSTVRVEIVPVAMDRGDQVATLLAGVGASRN